MPIAPRLRGGGVELRPFTPADIGPAYLSWLRDVDVVRYTDVNPTEQTLESIRAYVDTIQRDPYTLFWAIHEVGYGHVGNLRMSGISIRHARATVALLIGDKSRWGRNLARDALTAASAHAFHALGLRKICAGILICNDASRRAFEKAGFHVEAVLRAHAAFEDHFVDVLQMARFADAAMLVRA
ncbi:MAG: GNAT family N-acetyltransferase [Alphaproteobacteria bacterium]